MGAQADKTTVAHEATGRPPLIGYRWRMAGMLFLVSVINYIDRQTLSALAPILKQDFGWSNRDYGMILNAFRISYTVMQAVVGRLLDRVGTRRGISWSVIFYSAAASLTAMAQGLRSFTVFRFFLGAGEAANNPGGAKAISEWFPKKERALAIGIFNSGCAVGGAIAPGIVWVIYRLFDSWRPAFIITGSLGFIWLIAWWKMYGSPEKHKKISREELEYIREGRSSSPIDEGAPRITWLGLLRYRQTWGIILGRFLLDPYWFFVAEWYGVYLKSKDFGLDRSILGFWAPFMGGLLGNYFAGWLSGFLVHRGWAVGRSRRTILMIFGPSMLILSLATITNSYACLLLLFAYSTFAYNCCGTMFLTLPTDVFHTRAVGTVMGLAGMGAGIGTLLSTLVIGEIADRFSFEPVILGASIIPCIATVFFVTMVRASKKPDPKGIVQEF